jgi:uncharacterized protein (DUF3084 family)
MNMKKMAVKIVIAVLLGVLITFTWGFFSLMRTARELAQDLGNTRQLASKLRTDLDGQIAYNKRILDEKFLLERELASLQEEISRSKEAISKLEQDVDKFKLRLGDLENRNVILRSRIESLAIQKKKLEAQLDELVKEKEDLETRFYSLDELRKAMRNLKENPSLQRKAKADDKISEPTADNKGYIIRGGKSTYKSDINVRVLPGP